MTPIQFTIYAYLVSRSGSKGYCWPTHETIVRDTGIGKTAVQEALKVLKKRQIISVSKHRKPYGFSNNEYTLLNLDNPEVYPALCRMTENDEQGGLRFEIDKHRISIRLTAPYDEHRKIVTSSLFKT